MMRTVAIAALLVLATGDSSVEDKNRPVSKVVNLLKDMVTQLEKEGQEDDDVYDTMGCWCETNDKLKTQAIADEKQRINTLTAAIEDLTAKSARLTTEISGLQKELSKNQQAVDTATALRNKQEAEFVAEEKDMLQSITSLKAAVISLSKHNKGSALLQADDEDTIDVLAAVNFEMHKHQDFLKEHITPRQIRVIKSLVEQKQTQGQQYAPQSNEIFGIMQAMKESFEINLASSTKDEARSKEAFDSLKEAKTEEINAGQENIDAKTQELAASDENCETSKQDLEDTSNLLDVDVKFLADLKDKCTNVDQEFEERKKTRSLEIAAVSKALEFLSSDDAHELFTKTFNFLQQRSQDRLMGSTREQAIKVLLRAARVSHDPRLSALAGQARLDAFSNLKKTIQTMVDRLLKEKDDEIKHKDFCVEQFNENSRDTEVKTQEKEETESMINQLTTTVEHLVRAIDELKAQIAELEKQMKQAGQDREAANKAFQVQVADQRATQKLLTTALGVLKGFYEKAALVQSTKATGKTVSGQAPPQGFKSYEKNAKSGGVMGMIESIIKDAKAMEAEAIYGEEKSQQAYEDFVMDTNEEVAVLQKDIADKTRVKGKTEADKLDEEVELDHIMEDLHQLSVENSDIHRSCDFLLKNYEVRTAARDQEIEALKQAIALFSGAKMAAMLQSLGK